MQRKQLRRNASPSLARRRKRSSMPSAVPSAEPGQGNCTAMGRWLEEFKRWMPPEWNAEMARAQAAQRPVRGAVRAPDAVVHDIIGNLTSCDIEWVIDDEWREMKKDSSRWSPVEDGAITCFACLQELQHLVRLG